MRPLAVSALSLAAALAAAPRAASAQAPPRPTSANCTTRWIANTVDHFTTDIPPENGGSPSWLQRVLVCDQFFSGVASGAIFFYVGNEGDVTLYANNTGLMWENAGSFGALLVFAEHRYYGQSWPLSGDPATSLRHMRFLSSQQALADYAVVLRQLKRELGPGGEDVPAVAFGGSYGGVLSAMFRSKYPGLVCGAIAASAPLRAFPTQLPDWDTGAYYARVTATASAAGGCPDACAANVRALWAPLFADAASDAGRARLSAAFRTCAPLATPDDGVALAQWVRSAFDVLAMGNYPWPSDYIAPGLGAFPMRAACAALAEPIPAPADLYAAVRDAVAVLYNASGSGGACFDIAPNPYTHPAIQYDGIWGFQQCTEWQPDSFFFSSDGVSDMFYSFQRNETLMAEVCLQAWNVTVTEQSKGWMATSFDFPRMRGGVSNIVFSMCDFDGWGSAGLESPDPARMLVSLNVSSAAHHADLMFSHPDDPPSFAIARAAELGYVSAFIAQARLAAAAAAAREL
jgi:lysosomal Pro-X carboxypeptidase